MRSKCSLALFLVSLLLHRTSPFVTSSGKSSTSSPRPLTRTENSFVRRWLLDSSNRSPERFIRWELSTSSLWNLQTAVTTYRRNDTLMELHAMVHYGNPGYFEYYNQLNGTVVYELLVDEDMLETKLWNDSHVALTVLKEPIGATMTDLQVASSYGLTCQASVIQYCRSNFIHGDWTRQDLLKMIDEKATTSPHSSRVSRDERRQPLWQQARRWSAGSEVAAALLVGPPMRSTTPYKAGRMATQSFPFRQVVHSRAIQLLRPLLWLTVPSPEVSILLLDWSASNDLALGSPASRAVLQSLALGDWDAIRKLVFGQVLVSNRNSAEHERWMSQRNTKAMDVVEQVIRLQGDGGDSSTISVLFGCLHCEDLHQLLVATGFQPVRVRWRTAWNVQVPPLLATRLLDSNVLKLLFLMVAYLGIGGLDWISTWGDVTRSYAEAARTSGALSELSGVMLTYAGYLVRHLFLYLGLCKFVWMERDKIGSVMD